MLSVNIVIPINTISLDRDLIASQLKIKLLDDMFRIITCFACVQTGGEVNGSGLLILSGVAKAPPLWAMTPPEAFLQYDLQGKSRATMARHCRHGAPSIPRRIRRCVEVRMGGVVPNFNHSPQVFHQTLRLVQCCVLLSRAPESQSYSMWSFSFYRSKPSGSVRTCLVGFCSDTRCNYAGFYFSSETYVGTVSSPQPRTP